MNMGLLQTALIVSVVIAYALERFAKPVVAVLEALGAALIKREGGVGDALLALYHLWPYYLSTALGGWLAWYTALNVLPIFVVKPVVGRLLTCAILGQGPAVLYDLVKQIKGWVEKIGAK